MIANKFANWLKARRVYAKWQRPAHFASDSVLGGFTSRIFYQPSGKTIAMKLFGMRMSQKKPGS